MNRQQLREDVETHLDKLPERFTSSTFYDSTEKCMCLYGWLANVVGHIPPQEMQEDTSSTWNFIESRYDVSSGDIIHADHIIRACGGHARTVAEAVMEALTDA